MCKHCPVSLDRLTQVISFPLTRAFKTIWACIECDKYLPHAPISIHRPDVRYISFLLILIITKRTGLTLIQSSYTLFSVVSLMFLLPKGLIWQNICLFPN